MVALGLWIKLGSTSFVRVLGSTSVNFVHIGYFCIVVGIMVAMLGFIGCWGAVKESRCLLRMVSTHSCSQLGRSPGPRGRGCRPFLLELGGGQVCHYDAPIATAT